MPDNKGQNLPVINIFWFRRDLRLSDNRGLFEALKQTEKVLPVFIFDTDILDLLPDKKEKRVDFIYRTLSGLRDELSISGSSLYVARDKPLNAFQKLTNTFRIGKVYANHDYEPYALARDKTIEKFLKEKGITFHTYKDQVVFEKSEVMKNDGTPYTVYTPYSKAWKEKLIRQPVQTYPSEKHKDNFIKTKEFHFPSLMEIGFESSNALFPVNIPNSDIIRHYDQTRDFPAVEGTSRLSVHLRFGTVSIRWLVDQMAPLNGQWLNELIWREFFMMILFHFPTVVTHSFKRKYDQIRWRNNEEEFSRWQQGETGYPLVDAGMRELNETGFMHNRVRMVTAGFLTKHLLIDWRWGEAYFADKLLDYELASNNGNWQWAAGSGCDAAPYFRIFNPTEQARKFDPESIYIKTWIPNFSPGYLLPIIEHDFARKRALEIYKNSLNDH